MTTLTIQLPDAHRDRLARSAPVRANWRSLAVAAIVVVASMAAEAAAAGDYYVRAGVGFDRPAGRNHIHGQGLFEFLSGGAIRLRHGR